MSAFKKRLRKAVSCGSQRTADPGRGNGADDESTGSNSEGGGRKAEVVGGRGNNGCDGPHDAALAGAAGAERLAGCGMIASAIRAPKRVPMKTVEEVLQLYREK